MTNRREFLLRAACVGLLSSAPATILRRADGSVTRMRRACRRVVLVAGPLLACIGSLADAAEPQFHSRACTGSLPATNVRCGIVRVPENYARPAGRKIDLWVVVLAATESKSSDVAQFDLEGGPGFAATDFTSFYLGEGAPYRRARDIVLVDRRGTGRSAPLRCPQIEQYQKTHPWGPMYPPELVAACAATLARRADLTQYTTAIAARDIDAVREALGYRAVHLNAVSYGTTLALRYIDDHPDRVRSAVLMGTAPSERTPPRFHATAAERALERIVRDCRDDGECAASYPDVSADLARALATFTGADAVERRAVFMEKLRTLMYTTAGQRRVPALLNRAATGDFAGFERTTADAPTRVFADGLYLAVTCSESFGAFDVDAARAAAQATRFGEYRLARQQAACARWQQATRGSTHAAGAAMRGTDEVPVAARPSARTTPVLFIAGDDDPVTPPEWAAATLAAFPNGRMVAVAHGGHVLDGLTDMDTCLDRVVLDFFARESVAKLDVSCFAKMRPPPFERANPAQIPR